MTQDARQQIRPDICVIGAGAGGLAAASAAAAFGVNVVLIEKAGMGGDSLGGVLPAKALLAAAGQAQILREAVLRNGARFGVTSPRVAIDFAAARAHVHEVVAAVAPQDSRERFHGLGVRVIAGVGRFRDPGTVAVNGFDVKARRFVIATGASPALPAIPGLAEVPHFTNETVLELADCPRHLVVIGAGSAGLELAQAFRRLGAEVTVLEAATPLGSEDAECAGAVIDALSREGIVLRSGVEITQVRRVLSRVQVDIAGQAGRETIEATHILVTTGRRPNLDELDLDAAGIDYEAGGITVDRRLRTSNKQVYAIGEVTGAPPLPHLANHHAGP
jgi:pyruvate/2-oxoglutarate dehydrogenase complex dihydrolipoamide dehydrogenase (E3) component